VTAINGEAIAVRAEEKAAALAVRGVSYTHEQINVIKSTVAVGASNEELGLFLTVAQRSGLDPFTKQIHFVKRWDSKQKREVGAFQVGIDGFRVIASRNAKYRGRVGPWWAGKDGQWLELWTDDAPPFAAKVGIVVDGYAEPVFATARWGAYVQTTKEGAPTKFWRDMGPEQLAKCAEALALRIAFPNDLSGLYTHDEMGQAANDDRPAAPAVAPRPAAAAIKRDAAVKAQAAASVAEVLADEETGAPMDESEGGMDAAPNDAPMSTEDRAEMLAQCAPDEILLRLAAMRQATKGERRFYESHAQEDGSTRHSIVDAELLLSFRDKPVNTWLDQIAKNAGAWRLFIRGMLKASDSLGIEVVR
jgi:phage recombination protein Bet